MFEHYLLSLFIVVIFSLIFFFINDRESKTIYKDILFVIIYSIPWSILALPVLVSVFVSYKILNKNISKRRKILITCLIYTFLGLLLPLILLIIGFSNYHKDQETGWFILLGVYSLIPYIVLIIVNYLFMYFTNKKLFKI